MAEVEKIFCARGYGRGFLLADGIGGVQVQFGVVLLAFALWAGRRDFASRVCARQASGEA